MLKRFRKLISDQLDQGGLKIAVIYLLVGGIWILCSENLAAWISTRDEMLVQLSTWKGWGFVLITGILLYWLIHRNNQSLCAIHKNYQLLAENTADVIWILGLNSKLQIWCDWTLPMDRVCLRCGPSVLLKMHKLYSIMVL